MTTQEKQIKVAEIVGIGVPKEKPTIEELEKILANPNPYQDKVVLKPDGSIIACPPYTTSIDAIRAAVLAQSEAFQKDFEFILWRMCEPIPEGHYHPDNPPPNNQPRLIHQLTASDWCDCFLAAHHASKGKD